MADNNAENSAELLTVGEAAKRAGVHANTVRRYLKSEDTPFFLRDMSNGNVVSGSLPEDQWPERYQYLVPARVVPYLASEAGDEVSAGPAPSTEPLPATESEADELETSNLRASLDSAEKKLGGAEQKLAAAEEQLAELRSERDWLRLHLRDITAFLPAAKKEAESARSDLELARETAERERERAEEIRRAADEFARDKDREIGARDLAVIRWQSLSWWARRGTNLEAIISEELEKLSSPES